MTKKPGKTRVSATRRELTPASLAKAKAAFSSFSLSKYAKGKPPVNHVAPGETAPAVQLRSMSSQVPQLPPNGVLSVALPKAQLAALLPSYDAGAGTVSLDDVMHALEKNMRGHEFFSTGNPTLNRLAIQTQVQDIIASVLKGGTK